jgi:Zn-dependent protease with chaperone function
MDDAAVEGVLAHEVAHITNGNADFRHFRHPCGTGQSVHTVNQLLFLIAERLFLRLVAVSSGLLQQMDDAAVEGVLAHEVAHITNGDMNDKCRLQAFSSSLRHGTICAHGQPIAVPHS